MDADCEMNVFVIRTHLIILVILLLNLVTVLISEKKRKIHLFTYFFLYINFLT